MPEESKNVIAVKLLEVRDSMTCIGAFAFRPTDTMIWPSGIAANAQQVVERYLLRRCGWAPGPGAGIIFGNLNDGKACSDVYDWPSHNRTMQVAHQYVLDNFSTIKSGDVIDVEFILRESSVKKVSEALEPRAENV